MTQMSVTYKLAKCENDQNQTDEPMLRIQHQVKTEYKQY